MAYSDAGRTDDAIKEYKTAISIADIYPQVHYNLGNALASIKKFDEAEAEYYKATNITPDFSLPYLNLLKIAILSKDETKLQTVLAKIKINFSEEYYLNQTFYSYYYLGNSAKAKSFGLELTKKYPNSSGEVGVLMLNIR